MNTITKIVCLLLIGISSYVYAQDSSIKPNITCSNCPYDSSGAVIFVYNCANIINVQFPFEKYFVAPFTCENGEIKQSADVNNKFLILPKEKEVTLTFGYRRLPEDKQSTLTEPQKFRVVNPPVPKVVFLVNEVEVDTPLTITKDKAIKLGIRIKPDNTFFNKMPNDAKYRFEDIAVYEGKPLQKLNISLVSLDDIVKTMEIPIPKSIMRKKSKAKYFEVVWTGINQINFRGEPTPIPNSGGKVRIYVK